MMEAQKYAYDIVSVSFMCDTFRTHGNGSSTPEHRTLIGSL